MIFKLFVLIISLITSGFSRPEYPFRNVFASHVDGVPAAENLDEVIKASRRVHEKLDEVDLSKTTVVNLFGSTALTLAGQLEQTPRVLSSIKHRMKELGCSREAIDLAQQQAKELMQNPDVADVIETHEAALQEVEQEVQKLAENLQRLEQKHEELAASDVLKAAITEADAFETPLETLQAQLEHMDLSTPEGQSLQYHIAAIDHDQKVNTLSHKLLLKTAETVEKFETFLERNPNLTKTMRYGVEGINGVLMATGVKGLLTSGLPKALVALGFGEAISTASSWAGGKVEGMVAEVATSESEAQRFMKALKTCAGTAGVVVGVKIATKSLKASKIQPPTIKDALSERPIIKDGKVWLGDKELGEVALKPLREGQVGRFKDLDRAGTFGDHLTPHHAPSAKYMSKHGISRNDGIAIMMEQPTPGTGGRHRQTRTYGNTQDSILNPRQELAQDISDLRRIYQEDNAYTPEIREGLSQLIEQNKKAHPHLFQEGETKK